MDDDGRKVPLVYESALAPPVEAATPLVRQRINAILRKSAGRPVTVVAAPAGYGKTVALADWYRSKSSPDHISWLTLRQHTNEPLHFWSGFVASIRTARPGALDETWQGLQRGQSPTGETFTQLLVNDLCQMTGPCVLVLDEFEHIENPEILNDLAVLIDNMPPNLRLVISGRSDPPFPLATWRVRGALSEIRAQTLSFNHDEAETFLDLTVAGELDADETDQLLRLCDGWIAGLYLASLGILETANPGRFIDELAETSSPIADYLVAAVVSKLPDPLQSFLADTSVLDELTSSLCDAVTQRDDSTRVLRNLHRSGLFALRISTPDSYAYHPLFRAVLYARSREENAARVELAHERAAKCLLQMGRHRDAIAQAIAGGHHALASSWLAEHATTMLMSGPGIVPGLLASLPPEMVDKNPELAALELRAATVEGSVPTLEQLTDSNRQGRVRPALEATARVAMRALRGDYEQLLDDTSPGDEQAAPRMRALAVGLALTVVDRLDEGATELEGALQDPPDDPFLQLSVLSLLGWNRTLSGHLGTGRSIALRAVELAGRLGLRWYHGVRYAELALAQVAYDRGQLDNAYRMADFSRHGGGDDVHAAVAGAILMSRIQWSLGNRGEARDTLDAAFARPEGRPTTGRLALRLALAQAELHLKERDPDLAEPWVPDWRSRVERGPESPEERLILARFLIADEAYEAARGLLTDPELEADRTTRYLVEAWKLGAIAAMHEGDPAAAMSLEIALAMAEPVGFVQTFIEDSLALSSVGRLGDSGVTATVGAVQPILASERSNAVAVPSQTSAGSVLVGELTDRELSVLRMLASRLSNKEIAHELYVSVNTVKSHVKSIYLKLDVSTRNDAVARATSLRLR